MKFSFEFTQAQLRVFSAICSNFVVFWLGTMVTTRDPSTLVVNAISAMVSWVLAVETEKMLEEL